MDTAENKAAWYAKNATRIKAKRRAEYASDPVLREKKKKVAIEHYANNKERKLEQSRRSPLKIKYGITPEQYTAMSAAQEGLCKICKRPPSASDPRKVRLCVDHDHRNNKIRDLLCHDCNVLLGFAQDSPAILQRAIEYLARHN
jgi:hypothetical protein